MENEIRCEVCQDGMETEHFCDACGRGWIRDYAMEKRIGMSHEPDVEWYEHSTDSEWGMFTFVEIEI